MVASFLNEKMESAGEEDVFIVKWDYKKVMEDFDGEKII